MTRLMMMCLEANTWYTSLSFSLDAPTTTQASSRAGGRWSPITDPSPLPGWTQSCCITNTERGGVDTNKECVDEKERDTKLRQT